MSLILENTGSVAVLKFDHGKANEMGVAELDALESWTDELAGSGVRALISFSSRVSRKGTPIFISGANVTERADWTGEQVAAHVRRQRNVLAKWRRLPLFHVAVVHGVALGWGTEYLLTADYQLATPGAQFGLPETGLGILPGAGGSSELWSMVGVAQALRLGMTGERIGVDEALRIGLIQEKVADLDAGLSRARALADRVVRNSPTAVAAFKRACLGSVGLEAAERRELEARAYEHCLKTGEAAVGRENFDAIRAG